MTKSDSIFLVNIDGNLEKVPYQEYENEDLLQEIIEKYPEILSGEQINPDDPLKWFVVKREAGIPGSEEEGNRWAVDHLFLDQHGRPTFIEIKRSSDSRIRREVVGQMLDYAANAQKYWPVDRIKTLSVEYYGSSSEVDSILAEFLGFDLTSDTSEKIKEFWDTVEQNLRNGRVRLLFVADKIPSELRRIIEFLNDNMPHIDVLGVEIRQYKGQTINALVPRLVGQTEAAFQQKKAAGLKISKEDFLNSINDLNTKVFFQRLFEESMKRGFSFSWGTKGFGIRATLPDGQEATYFYGFPAGSSSSPVPLFQAYLGYIKNQESRVYLINSYIALVPFVLKGDHTLEVRLDDEILPIIDSALSSLLDIVKNYSNGKI